MPERLEVWPRKLPAAVQRSSGLRPRWVLPLRPSPAGEGYWQEWAPEAPEAHTGYCAQLFLPPGAHVVTATAAFGLAGTAPGPAEVECSLFVAAENRCLHQLVVAPGQGQSLAATAHVESGGTTDVQWVLGSTAAPFRLQLAVTAVRVTRLHHGGVPPTG